MTSSRLVWDSQRKREVPRPAVGKLESSPKAQEPGAPVARAQSRAGDDGRPCWKISRPRPRCPLGFLFYSGPPQTAGCPPTSGRASAPSATGASVGLIQGQPPDSAPGTSYQIDGHPRSGRHDPKPPRACPVLRKGSGGIPETGSGLCSPRTEGSGSRDQRLPGPPQVLPCPLPHVHSEHLSLGSGSPTRAPSPSLGGSSLPATWSPHCLWCSLQLPPSSARRGPAVSRHAGRSCRGFPGDCGK